MTDNLTLKIRIAVREARRRELLDAINHKDDRARLEYAKARILSKHETELIVYGRTMFEAGEFYRRALRTMRRLVILNRKYAK